MKKFLTILPLWAVMASQTWAQQTPADSTQKQLQEMVVSGIQTDQKKPVISTTIGKKQIAALYYGVDIPGLIQVTPSVNSYSDNGTGIGYSYFRLRGMDQTRINTTVNGIPVNDPENQGVYFNNFADLASSADQIQVQRGIGTSTNGTSAFGGSININTRSLSSKPQGSLYLGMGSFGSSRVSVEAQTGLMDKHWMFYGRLGRVKTNGYRDHSGAEVYSYLFTLGYQSSKTIVKFNFFGGNAKSQLAYSGIDQSTFNNAPKTNPFVNGEGDAFNQYFNQIQLSHRINANAHISASVYLVKGSAPKFQFLFPAAWGYGFDFFNMAATPYYVNGADTIYSPGDVMSSYRLKQTLSGAFVNYNYQYNKLSFNAGVHMNHFVSDHFMEAMSAGFMPPGIEPNHQVYFNTGTKDEISAALKLNYQVHTRLSLFADVQIRNARFDYHAKTMEYRWADGKVENMNWLFVNPRLGGKFDLNEKEAITFFAGLSHREPTRFDYFQDDYAPRDIKQNEIKPENVLDYELAYHLKGRKVSAIVNLYAMEFKSQIVGTGAINNFGYPVTGNIGKSYRRGIELDVNVKLQEHFNLGISSNMSQNKAEKISLTYSNTDANQAQTIEYKNTTLALSPSYIHAISLKSNWFKNCLLVDVFGRAIGMQYLDNTQNKLYSLPAFAVLDLGIQYVRPLFSQKYEAVIGLRVNNILDEKYASSGSLGGYNTINNNGDRGQIALFFPSATRNLFLTASIRF